MKNIKHELVNDDSIFVGTGLEIVKQLRDQAYFERGLPLGGYLDSLVGLISKSTNKNITLPEGDIEDRAEAFVQELIGLGIFKEA